MAGDLRGAAARSAARLITAAPGEIALLKNTSEGLATVAMGLDWRAGDKIVAFREEFPANQYPWQRLEAKGVTNRMALRRRPTRPHR